MALYAVSTSNHSKAGTINKVLQAEKIDILRCVSHYVKEILKNLSSIYTFHSLQHTIEVVEASMEIARHCNLGSNELELVLIASWFHDTGFKISPYNHEVHSIKIAREFLRERRYPEQGIMKISGCIKATQLPQNPQNLLEEIVSDADMFHLSTRDYWCKNQLLKRELELLTQSEVRNDQWCFENLNFLRQHQYHTEYGKNVLSKHKQANLSKNVQKLESLKAL